MNNSNHDDQTTDQSSAVEVDSTSVSPRSVPVEIVGAAPESDRQSVPEVEISVEADPESVDADVSMSVEQTTDQPETSADNEEPTADNEESLPVVDEPEVELSAEEPEQDAESDSGSQGFAELGLDPAIVVALEKRGYRQPTSIQAATIPHLMQGRDLIGQAETGSGKTAAFTLPILSRLDFEGQDTLALVLTPTRELAIQVTEAVRSYGAGIKNFRTTTIYGGQNYQTQFRALERGAHVVVGTPGRLLDHLEKGTLDLSQLKVFVLDEADEMLRMGFIEDIETILEQAPRDKQTVCFSATMPAPIKRIAKRYLNNPEHVKIESDSVTADSITQCFQPVEPREKTQRLVRWLQTEDYDGVLVFVKTRNSTNVVSEQLIQNGIIASALNGDIPQQQRERTVEQLKAGKINVVVATDVAARGLDVSRISHVINFDFPHDTEAYVHRIGRTGRAGRSGTAILYVEPREKGKLGRLQRDLNLKIEPLKQRSLKEINQARVEKFKQRILDAADDKQFDFFKQLVTEFKEQSELDWDQVAAALAVMAQGGETLLLEALQSPTSNWKQDRNRRGRERFEAMKTFRVEVGRTDGVGPGNLVGAITNEAGIDNSSIGKIRIFDRFSTIDLPADFPDDLVEHLAEVRVSGQPLKMKLAEGQHYEQRGSRGSRDQRGSRDRRRGPGKPPGGFRRGKPGSDRGRRFSGGSRGDDEHRDGGDNGRRYSGRPRGDSRSEGSDRGRPRTRSGGASTRSKREHDRPRRTGKKTKAALRTKSKRKPDAEISSPVKKYVKIRQVKKKRK